MDKILQIISQTEVEPLSLIERKANYQNFCKLRA